MSREAKLQLSENARFVHPDAATQEVGRVGVAEHVEVEVDAGARPESAHQLVHRLVAQRSAVGRGEEVHEHVVRVELAPPVGRR